MPTVSIIVPVYNVEKYLRRCIDSILSQSFTDFELLLIDDGSKDSSGSICDEYAAKDSRIRVFHKENGGVSSARNLGLDNARGEWIYFVDADDEVLPNGLQILVSGISDDVDMVVGGWMKCDQNNNEIYNTDNKIHRFLERNEAARFSYMSTDNHFWGFIWKEIFRVDVIKNNNLRFDEHIYITEDSLFFIAFLCNSRKKVYYNSALVYKYYVNRESATAIMRINFERKHLTDNQALYSMCIMIMNHFAYDKDLVLMAKKKVLSGIYVTNDRMALSKMNVFERFKWLVPIKKQAIGLCGAKLYLWNFLGHYKSVLKHKILSFTR